MRCPITEVQLTAVNDYESHNLTLFSPGLFSLLLSSPYVKLHFGLLGSREHKCSGKQNKTTITTIKPCLSLSPMPLFWMISTLREQIRIDQPGELFMKTIPCQCQNVHFKHIFYITSLGKEETSNGAKIIDGFLVKTLKNSHILCKVGKNIKQEVKIP